MSRPVPVTAHKVTAADADRYRRLLKPVRSKVLGTPLNGRCEEALFGELWLFEQIRRTDYEVFQPPIDKTMKKIAYEVRRLKGLGQWVSARSDLNVGFQRQIEFCISRAIEALLTVKQPAPQPRRKQPNKQRDEAITTLYYWFKLNCGLDRADALRRTTTVLRAVFNINLSANEETGSVAKVIWRKDSREMDLLQAEYTAEMEFESRFEG